MPTAKKLPSGNYRVQVFSHKEGNKRVYKSFTAPTKREAELIASQYKNGKHVIYEDKTVNEAVKGYISAKEGVLSPSTVRGYVRMVKYYQPIRHVKISKLDNEKLQRLISDLSQKLSPKTVSNVYGLLVSSIGFYCPDKRFNITLPKIIHEKTVSPSDGDIQALFNAADNILKACIALAAYGSLRRGEISALKYSDIDGNTLHIHADLVKDKNGIWVYKVAKTPDSIRYKSLPKEVIDLLGSGEPDDYVIKWTPDSITKRFIALRKKQGINIRFHDLRHYYASIGAALGIPDLYIADSGGWKQNSKVLKSVYQNKITPISKAFENKLNDHFSDLINGKVSHKCNT
jgi:integrase